MGHGGVGWGAVGHGGVWRSMLEYDGVWWDVVEWGMVGVVGYGGCGRVW